MDIPFGLEPWLFWLLLSLGLFILELFTPGFFVACLGIGALTALLPSLIGLSFAWQLAFFSAGSLLSIYFLRPLLRTKDKRHATGVEALIGREVLLTEELPEHGRSEVRIDGDVWRIELRDKGAAPSGARLRIVGIKGIILQGELV